MNYIEKKRLIREASTILDRIEMDINTIVRHIRSNRKNLHK